MSAYPAAARHFIHYIRRVVLARFPSDIKHPWFADVRKLNSLDDFARPRFHATRRASGPAQQVRAGDVIWLVSQIHSPWGTLPPALDARIVVSGVRRGGDGKTTYRADETSEWFPLWRAGAVLNQLETLAAAGTPQPLLKQPDTLIGQALQSMREVANPQVLERHAAGIRQRPMHFISYRLVDGTRAAFQQAGRLMAKGQVVFWDRWCLPRRMAERREVADAQALDDHLMCKLEASVLVWAVPSPKYAAPGSYSAREYQRATTAGKCRPVRA